MELTKKYETDLAKAMRCSESGKAYHWPTVAAILADEVNRLKNNKAVATSQEPCKNCSAWASLSDFTYCPDCSLALNRRNK